MELNTALAMLREIRYLRSEPQAAWLLATFLTNARVRQWRCLDALWDHCTELGLWPSPVLPVFNTGRRITGYLTHPAPDDKPMLWPCGGDIVEVTHSVSSGRGLLVSVTIIIRGQFEASYEHMQTMGQAWTGFSCFRGKTHSFDIESEYWRYIPVASRVDILRLDVTISKDFEWFLERIQSLWPDAEPISIKPPHPPLYGIDP
jgi:hypothetical protein